MKKLTFTTFIVIFTTTSFASIQDFFGTSASTASVSGMGNSNPSNGGNNYYLPAILGYSKSNTAEYSFFNIEHSFPAIDNIVTKNGTNNSDAPITDYGPTGTKYETVTAHAINIVVPSNKLGGAFGFTYTGPITYLVETNSGNAYLPEYVMYRSRYKRTAMNLNYAHPVNQNISISLGFHMGLQISSDVESNMSLNGNDYGSNAYMKTKTAPAFAGIFSCLYRNNNHLTYLTYHQEMKSNISSKTYGLTNNLSVAFDVNLESLLYYDPQIFRVGYNYKKSRIELLSAVEYQMWGNYRSPVIHVKRNSGGIISSDDYESINTKNILIPKIGTRFSWSNNLKTSAGFGYRPTPLSGDFSGAGNSIDCDKYIYSLGISYLAKTFGVETEYSIGGQYHQLEETTISKSSNMENGDSGLKIGASNYTIGGNVTTIAIGAQLTL